MKSGPTACTDSSCALHLEAASVTLKQHSKQERRGSELIDGAVQVPYEYGEGREDKSPIGSCLMMIAARK